MSKVIRRPSANRDLLLTFRHYARTANLRTADRFFVEVEATLDRLARMPGLGTRYAPDDPLYADLRYFPISGFRQFVVFYREIPDGIEVVRVLHGARDISGILTEEFEIPDAGDAY